MRAAEERLTVRRSSIFASFALAAALGGPVHAQGTAPADHSTNAPSGLIPSPADVSQALPSSPTPPEQTTNPTFLIVPSVSTTVTGTSNAYFGANAGFRPRSDVLVDVAEGLLVRSMGSGVQINGDFTLHGLYSADHTQADHFAPRGSLDVLAQLIPNTLFLDTSLSSTQSLSSPFLGLSNTPSTLNSYTTNQFRLSPYIDREIAPDLTLGIRSDNLETTYAGSTGGASLVDSYSRNDVVRLTERPLPFGWGIKLEDEETRFSGDSRPILTNEAARLDATAAIVTDLELGVDAGYERTELNSGTIEHAIYGIMASWAPSPRTRLDATVESRFFGTGWNVLFSRQGSQAAFTGLWTRTATSYPQTLISGSGGANIPGLLEAVLSTLYPNPIERAQAANNIINLSGLPKSLSGTIGVYTEEALLVSSASGTVVWFIPRNTASLTVFQSRTQELQGGSQPVVPLLASSGIQNQQVGVSFSDGYRLSPVSAVTLTATDRLVEALPAVSGLHTRQIEVDLEYSIQLGPRSNAGIGLRRQLLDSNLIGSSNESALLFRFTQRF